jgi:hypothetical protein
MDFFDFSSATFVKADNGSWHLARDWDKHPPTPREIEVLLAHCLQMDRLLAAFVRHFAAGNIQTADALNDATIEEVMRLLSAVRDIVTPPSALPPEGKQVGWTGASE